MIKQTKWRYILLLRQLMSIKKTPSYDDKKKKQNGGIF